MVHPFSHPRRKKQKCAEGGAPRSQRTSCALQESGKCYRFESVTPRSRPQAYFILAGELFTRSAALFPSRA
jgi:hypothetical protein